jgi:hypothetical protein
MKRASAIRLTFVECDAVAEAVLLWERAPLTCGAICNLLPARGSARCPSPGNHGDGRRHCTSGGGDWALVHGCSNLSARSAISASLLNINLCDSQVAERKTVCSVLRPLENAALPHAGRYRNSRFGKNF